MRPHRFKLDNESMKLNLGQLNMFYAIRIYVCISSQRNFKFPGCLGNSILTNFRKDFYTFFSFEIDEIDQIICSQNTHKKV